MIVALLILNLFGNTLAQDTRCNGVPSTNWSCCDGESPCEVGGGDCDRDSDCLGSLQCGNNNCQGDFSGDGSNWASNADCCYDIANQCTGSPSTDWNCCSESFPCAQGGGDCDNDDQCQGSLVCGADNCARDFSSNGHNPNWATGADCCRETNSYVKSSNQGACCVSSNEQHEGCVIHSTYADVSEQICKRACDNDAFCKGYSISDVNGGMFCRLATSPSQCPHNWDTITGGNAPLNPTAACVSSFSGCYVKQNANIPVTLPTTPMVTTTTEATTGASGNCIYSTNEACEGNAVGRYPAADGDLDACIRYQQDNGRSFAVYWANKCYGSRTCNNPYSLSGTVNYEVQYCTETPTETTTETVTETTSQPGPAPSLTIDCSSPFEEVLTPGTVIMSPNYPNNYNNSADCQVTIRFANSPTVLIEFDPIFNIESHASCGWDYLEARDGPDASANRIGAKLCGTTAPTPVQSTGNSMTLIFHTDGSVTKTGFKITANPAGPAPTTTPGPTLPPPSSANCGIKPNRIIGGGEAGPYSLPWQVALVEPGNDDPFCGGTLISDRHVLTAAHCTGRNGGVWDVMVGEHDTTSSSDGTRHTKCRLQDHPQYDSPSPINNDFSIVTLSQPVTIGTRANYACLPTSALAGNFLDDKTMTVSGWGRNNPPGNSSPARLYKVDLPGLSNSACSQLDFLRLPITSRMLCAGRHENNPVGACHGDSGGPLTYNDNGRVTLVGAVSWGNPSCVGTTVFARVTEVLPWIQEQMRQPCQ